MSVDVVYDADGCWLVLDDGGRFPVEAGLVVRLGGATQWLPASEWQISDESARPRLVVVGPDGASVAWDTSRVRVEQITMHGDRFRISNYNWTPPPTVADAGPTPYDAVVLHFDRLDDGTLVALYTHEGRSVAAVVHPRHSLDGGDRRWSLAGDIRDRSDRPHGAASSASLSCAEAAQVLGSELGIDVVGYEVTP